jgi:hypothetical protein
MEPSRKAGMVLVLMAVLGWTAYCLFFLMLMGVPSIDGAAEEAGGVRLTIVLGWIAGLAVGAVAALGLRRGMFNDTPPRTRARLAVAGVTASAALVVAFYWAGMSGTLLFLWGPILGAVLLLAAWASPPSLRRRLTQAVAGALAGFGVVAALFLILPPGMLGFHFWTLLAVVAFAAAAWWIWPVFMQRTRHPSTH